ncbi:MAG TPA: hypothetical protein VGM18_16210 [Candidatus Sulfotelmatobacter sp.]|jgi:hypothetical protein
MTSPFEILRHWWDYYRERPFLRLVELFLARIFRGSGDADAEGLDLGVGLVLTMLAMPGGFVSLLLLDKYGTFAQWLRGITNVDVLQAALPDEYFFIVLSMTVTGAVAVWRWDAIFPDRRDYINLVPLPIATRTIFFANLVAVVFLGGLVAFDVNAVSCILFPAVVAATQMKFFFFVKFGAVHAIGVLLSSLFSFFAVFSVLGLLMAMLPPSAFRRGSAYARGLVVIYLVALLCTTAAVPNSLRHLRGNAPGWAFLLPSCWFLGLCQWMRGRATPAMIELARLTFPLIGGVVVVAFCAYVAGYRRHFVRISELTESVSAPGRNRRADAGDSILGHLSRLLLRTAFQIGGFSFVWKTLRRSEAHRLVMTAVAGLGLVLSSQALMDATENATSARQAALSPDALSIPFILTFLVVAGLRLVFELPVELRANWLFQLMIDSDQRECERLARNVILTFVLPCVFFIAFPVYAYLEGWLIASLHTLLVGTWAVLLTNILLVRFRKLPFTCTLPLFKQHSIVILLSFGFGFLIYALSTSEFEATALREPLRMISLVPVAFLAWLIPHRLAKSTPEIDRKMIFEESASRTIEVLQLGD